MVVKIGIPDHGRTSEWAFVTYGGKGFINSELATYHSQLNAADSKRVHDQAATGEFTSKEELDAQLQSAGGHAQLYKTFQNDRRRGKPWRIGFKGPYRTKINDVDVEFWGYDHIEAPDRLANGDIDISVHGYDETATHAHLRGNWGLHQNANMSQFKFHGSALLDVDGRKGDFSAHVYTAPEGLNVKYRGKVPNFTDIPNCWILIDGLYKPVYIVENPEHAALFVDHEKDERFTGKLETDAVAHKTPAIVIVNTGGTIKRTGGLKACGQPPVQSESLVITRQNYDREPRGDEIKKVLPALDPVGYGDKRRLDQLERWYNEILTSNLDGIWEERPPFEEFSSVEAHRRLFGIFRT